MDREHIKLWSDYLKHLSTTSTAGIIALLAILKGIVHVSSHEWVAVLSILLFFFSVLFAMLANMLLMNVRLVKGADPSEVSVVRKYLMPSLFLANGSFVVAVFLIAIYTASNL